MNDTECHGSDRLRGHGRARLLLVALPATPLVAALALMPDARAAGAVASVVVQVAGVLLLISAVLFYLHWHGRPMVEEGWTVAATGVIAVQVLSSAGFALGDAQLPQAPWATAVDTLSAAVVLGLIACRRVERVGDPLLLGLGLGLALVGIRMLVLVAPQLTALPVVMADVGLLVILAAYLGAARGIRAEPCLPEPVGRRLATAVCLIGVGEVGLSVRWSWDLVAVAASLTLAVAAVLCTSTTYLLVRGATSSQYRRTAELEASLHRAESDARAVHERLHEVKCTIAGIANAHRLLRDDVLAPETRQRLERMIRAELDRVERQLGDGPSAGCGPVDLDETLDVLLESHRARGRTIEWKPSGASVQGDRDDVAEVLNILLDNAAKHGGGAPSRVDVRDDAGEINIAVCDEGPGVPRELHERIFEWGARAGTAPGKGIGLNVARRLVTQHGGTLTVADQDARGSAFVVRLPAARTSESRS